MSDSTADGVPAIDPRIRARRIEVQRDAGRRRLRRLTIAGSVFGLAFVGWLITRTPLLDVDTVNVAGAEHTREQVAKVVGSISHQPMVDVDPSALEARLESLPWVLDAHVEQHYPDRVDIVLTERAAAAAIQVKTSFALVDETGRVLDHVRSLPKGIVAVESSEKLPRPGANLDEDVMGAVEVATRASAALGTSVRGVRIGKTGIVLTLDDGALALLGSSEQLTAKLNAVAAILEQVDRRCLAKVDARVASSPVLTRQQGCG